MELLYHKMGYNLIKSPRQKVVEQRFFINNRFPDDFRPNRSLFRFYQRAFVPGEGHNDPPKGLPAPPAELTPTVTPVNGAAGPGKYDRQQ